MPDSEINVNYFPKQKNKQKDMAMFGNAHRLLMLLCHIYNIGKIQL